jgi:hypothetical protein
MVESSSYDHPNWGLYETQFSFVLTPLTPHLPQKSLTIDKNNRKISEHKLTPPSEL